MDLRLTGQTVLIPDASQGIGASLARAFAEEGCHLHLTARNQENLEAIRAEIASTYPLRRPAHVHEVTDLIVFLASFCSGYTSGTIITVDGGSASRRSIV